MSLLAYLQGLDVHDRLVIAIVFAWLALFLVFAARELYLAHRNNQQLRAEIELHRGFRELDRRGWLPEDLQ